MILSQTLGGAVFAAVSQNIIDNALIKNIIAAKIPDIDPATVVSAGATNLRHLVPANYLTEFVKLYSDAVTKGFLVAVGTSSLCILGAAIMHWSSTKQHMKPKTSAPADAPQTPIEGAASVETRKESAEGA